MFRATDLEQLIRSNRPCSSRSGSSNRSRATGPELRSNRPGGVGTGREQQLRGTAGRGPGPGQQVGGSRSGATGLGATGPRKQFCEQEVGDNKSGEYMARATGPGSTGLGATDTGDTSPESNGHGATDQGGQEARATGPGSTGLRATDPGSNSSETKRSGDYMVRPTVRPPTMVPTVRKFTSTWASVRGPAIVHATWLRPPDSSVPCPRRCRRRSSWRGSSTSLVCDPTLLELKLKVELSTGS